MELSGAERKLGEAKASVVLGGIRWRGCGIPGAGQQVGNNNKLYISSIAPLNLKVLRPSSEVPFNELLYSFLAFASSSAVSSGASWSNRGKIGRIKNM